MSSQVKMELCPYATLSSFVDGVDGICRMVTLCAAVGEEIFCLAVCVAMGVMFGNVSCMPTPAGESYCTQLGRSMLKSKFDNGCNHCHYNLLQCDQFDF